MRGSGGGIPDTMRESDIRPHRALLLKAVRTPRKQQKLNHHQGDISIRVRTVTLLSVVDKWGA